MAAQEVAPTPDLAAEESAPAGIKSKLPMIAMVAVGLAVGGGSGAAFIGPMVAKKLGKVAAPHAEAGADSAADKKAEGKPGEKGKEGEKGASSAETSVLTLENLVLNPANSTGTRFLLLSVAIEAATPAVVTEMKARDAELRDLILSSLGTKTVEQLTDMAFREPIKKEVLSAITSRFGKASVKRLYFPTFVVQ